MKLSIDFSHTANYRIRQMDHVLLYFTPGSQVDFVVVRYPSVHLMLVKGNGVGKESLDSEAPLQSLCGLKVNRSAKVQSETRN